MITPAICHTQNLLLLSVALTALHKPIASTKQADFKNLPIKSENSKSTKPITVEPVLVVFPFGYP
jgi:hypothetical protein